MDLSQIKCGKCSSVYYPRNIDKSDPKHTLKETDYSCPVCNYGKTQESFGAQGKTILKG